MLINLHGLKEKDSSCKLELTQKMKNTRNEKYTYKSIFTWHIILGWEDFLNLKMSFY